MHNLGAKLIKVFEKSDFYVIFSTQGFARNPMLAIALGVAPSPKPQPFRQVEYRQELPCTTRYEADVSQTIQQCSCLGDALQLLGQPSVDYVADAAKSINFPKHHTRHITEKQT